MRLLNCRTFRLHLFTDDLPPYAILSHLWYEDEISFEDVQNNNWRPGAGYRKITSCVSRALHDGLEYVWIDTCCINKTSPAELSEAINSMFRWSRNASCCYVYLSDVSADSARGPSEVVRDFAGDRWFTRCWTLQELLAPANVQFFSREWSFIGDKISLEREIHSITGVPVLALRGAPLSHFSVAERFSWAERRQATRGEDWAYSLLGIFGVNMPLLYGEGKENAVRRLLREVDGFVAPEDPAMVEPLYSELDPDSFRLFILYQGDSSSAMTGYLTKQDFRNHPPYRALSYTWGDEPPIHRIDINYQPFYIRPNLFHALQRLRSPTEAVFLWIDSLCINQSDDAEKSAQVRRMAEIYKKAESVWIWLGEESWESKAAMNFIPRVNHHDLQQDGRQWWRKDVFAAFNQLLARPWFRRRWVIQEAAFAGDSIIFCGDRQVEMSDFAHAVGVVRRKVDREFSSADDRCRLRDQFLSNFRDSPATRLLDIIGTAFLQRSQGVVLRDRPLLSLETLVELSSFCETKKPHDAIFALLSLANDNDSAPPVDYGRKALDVFADFVLHCCRSGSLDIICRPWAPLSPSNASTIEELDQLQEMRRCSWLRPANPPFFNSSPSRPYQTSLVGTQLQRTYNAHNGTAPRVYLGRNGRSDECNGSLHVTGFVLGKITQQSARIADAIITGECLAILGMTSDSFGGRNGNNVPGVVWRTLCADRDRGRRPAPPRYRSAIVEMIRLNYALAGRGTVLTDEANIMPSIEVEELLEEELPEGVEEVLEVIRGVVCNRRTFRGKEAGSNRATITGLVPQTARIGDKICILYGCSVPVLLRKQIHSSGNSWHWELIGEAYVDGFMDGEAIRRLSPATLRSLEVLFEIR
ncbi:heterokaryon incompatibility protein-domain-containing protein [Echria macrotheca]|uniref:Heterokaryon incompatibility protein-domain-containing protein n=1 Tax=Echria macrotheca TaxID=438768 RepID=A0AAJ0B1T0_9PEZI|nr:heterokaryon incompatibility protein-domain-containing protein [Echria macrotheca]